MARLRRSDCSTPGITRRRRGMSFSYIDPRGFDAYNARLIIRPALEDVAASGGPNELPIHQPAVQAAVLDLIDERESSPALERVAA